MLGGSLAFKKLSLKFRSFFKSEDGTTAIEFGLLFIPYLTLTIAIIEISVMYASASLLEGATNSAARLIRTGQLQQAQNVDPQDMFRDALCDYTTVLVNCNQVQLEVVTMDSFADFAGFAPTYDEDGNLVSQGFDAGGSNDRVLVRVAYNYTMLTPFIGPLLAGADNRRRFVSTIVLQTEPYEFEGNA